MESIDAVMHMGGYAGYVWPAYAISALVLAVVLIASLTGARKAEAELDILQQTRRARRAASSESA